MSWDDKATPEAAEPTTVYADAEEFVTEFLAPTYRRALGPDRLWCASWREHPEAVERLTALWQAFEHLRTKPLGASTWWLHHCDPTMRALLAEDGPFRYCGGGHRDQLDALPVEPERG